MNECLILKASYMGESMNGWIDARMKYSRINQSMKHQRRILEGMNYGMNEYMRQTDMNERTNVLPNKWVNEWVDEWMGKWMSVRMNK